MEECIHHYGPGLDSRRSHMLLLRGFTGIDDPYEPPECCEIVMQPRNGVCPTPRDMVEQIVAYLEEKGLLEA